VKTFILIKVFERTIGFSFRVAAESREELRPMYNRLNMLMSQVYPDYSPVTNIMRAPLVRLTIGDYMYRMPGFLENVNITVDNNYSWEINLEKSNTGEIAQLPQVVDVSATFRPIFDVLPKRSGFTTISKAPTVNQADFDPQDPTRTIIQTENVSQNASITPLITDPKGNFIKDLTEIKATSVRRIAPNELTQ